MARTVAPQHRVLDLAILYGLALTLAATTAALVLIVVDAPDRGDDPLMFGITARVAGGAQDGPRC